MRARIDHFIVGGRRPIAEILEAYEEIGFITSGMEGTVRHQPGLRTGFLYFSPRQAMDYVEILTVEDREVYEAAQTEDKRERVEEPYAQGLGIRVSDTQALHAALTAQGVSVNPVWCKRSEGASEDSPWRWSFVTLVKQRSGLGAFFVQYLTKKETKTGLCQGPNGIYALGGLLYESTDAAACMSKLALDLPQELLKIEGERLRFGCHDIMITPPPTDIPRNPELNSYGVMLLTDSLEKTEAYLRGKWKPYRTYSDRLELLPTDFEGLMAVVVEKPVSEWEMRRLQEPWLF